MTPKVRRNPLDSCRRETVRGSSSYRETHFIPKGFLAGTWGAVNRTLCIKAREANRPHVDGINHTRAHLYTVVTDGDRNGILVPFTCHRHFFSLIRTDFSFGLLRLGHDD